MGKRGKGVSREFLLSEAPSTLCLGDTARNLQPNIPQSTTLRKEKNPQSWSCRGRGLALPKGEGWNIPRFSHCSLFEALAGSLSEAESGQGRHRTVLRQSSPRFEFQSSSEAMAGIFWQCKPHFPAEGVAAGGHFTLSLERSGHG